jgi:LytS/YehU family sensor histidine kinase
MAGAQIYRELRAESARRERAELAWRDARLEVLRAQFDPHFLFNTLNTVANLSEQNPGAVRNVVVKLSDLLRQSLIDRKQEFVTVTHELEAVAAYMDIQRARFGDRLHFSVNVAPEVGAWPLPCFILQPLLENAVRHGLGGDEDSVDIDLLIMPAVIAPGTRALSITLANTVAVPGDSRIQLGLGLSLTRERLATLLGPAATVVAGTAADGRFQVLMKIPSHARGNSEP